jgi:hypothetical protein
MIVADDPVATEYASATIMDKVIESKSITVRYPFQLKLPLAPGGLPDPAYLIRLPTRLP